MAYWFHGFRKALFLLVKKSARNVPLTEVNQLADEPLLSVYQNAQIYICILPFKDETIRNLTPATTQPPTPNLESL